MTEELVHQHRVPAVINIYVKENHAGVGIVPLLHGSSCLRVNLVLIGSFVKTAYL